MGWTPLHQAALDGDVKTAMAALKEKPEIDAFASDDPSDEFYFKRKHDSQITPLTIAITHYHFDVARLLIRAGAKLSRVNSSSPPLQIAAEQGDLPFVQFLLASGVDVNSRDSSSNTALHAAKTDAIAAMLLHHGADATVRNAEGETPLHRAATPEIARLLLAQGVPLDPRDTQGRTPLFVATSESRFPVAKMLVTRGANVNPSRDRDNWGVLQWAIKNNDADLVHRLLRHGAQVHVHSDILIAAENGIIDSGNNDGSGISADRGPTTIARLLIAYGADLNARNAAGRTPLIEASLTGDDIMVPLLLAHDVDIDAADSSGYTALHWAAMNGEIRVVRQLVEHGADIATRNNEGQTPLDLARAWRRGGPYPHQERPDSVEILSRVSQ